MVASQIIHPRQNIDILNLYTCEESGSGKVESVQQE